MFRFAEGHNLVGLQDFMFRFAEGHNLVGLRDYMFRFAEGHNLVGLQNYMFRFAEGHNLVGLQDFMFRFAEGHNLVGLQDFSINFIYNNFFSVSVEEEFLEANKETKSTSKYFTFFFERSYFRRDIVKFGFCRILSIFIPSPVIVTSTSIRYCQSQQP